MVYLFLVFAIVFEIVAITALKATSGFTRLLPSIIFAASLAASFYLESLALKVLPVGWTYAVWAGFGIVGMALVGALLYDERINPGVMVGMVLIIFGIAVVHYFTPVHAALSDPSHGELRLVA